MRVSANQLSQRAAVLLASLALVGAADRQLVDAARDRDLGEVKALLERGTAIDAASADGAVALHWAAYLDDLEMADLLLESGATVDARNDLGVTPLSLACANGSATMVERLLAAGADAEAALPSGETPILTAARTGATEAVRALIESGADVRARVRESEQTALMWAISEGHADVVRLLLEHGAPVDSRSKGGSTPLHFAARRGDRGLAETLIEHGADLAAETSDGATPLLVATVRGHVDLARDLLERGADPSPDTPGYTALHWAAGSWETEMTGPNGIRIPAGHEWSAMSGLAERRLELVEALLEHGADPDVRLEKNPPRVGYTVFSSRPKGATPFYLAAMAGDAQVMRALVRGGADPNLLPEDGTTPLMAAAGVARALAESRVTEEQTLSAVRLSAELGNDVNARNVRGETALHGAARIRADSVVHFLIDEGADVSAQNERGQTPLFIAERYFHPGSAPLVERTSTGDLLRRHVVPRSADDFRDWDSENPMIDVNPVLPDRFSVPGRQQRPLRAATDPPEEDEQAADENDE